MAPIFSPLFVVTASELHLYLSDPLKKTWNQDPCFFNFTKNSGQFVFIPKGFETRPLESSETTTSASLLQPVMEEPGRSSIQEIETVAPTMEGAGYLYITAEPAGVKARITTPEGKNHEDECPVRLRNLKSGVYVASLSRPMYHPEKIALKVGVGVSKAHVELKPNFGRLTVISEPEGADIYLDGIFAVEKRAKKNGWYANRHSGMAQD